jgi:hypothetical protein
LKFRLIRELRIEVEHLLARRQRYYFEIAEMYPVLPGAIESRVHPRRTGGVDDRVAMYPLTVHILKHVVTDACAEIAVTLSGRARALRLTRYLYETTLAQEHNRLWIVLNHLPTEIARIAGQVASDERMERYQQRERSWSDRNLESCSRPLPNSADSAR